MTAISLVVNHLWQSTLFLAFAGLLTLTLHRNRARTRYGLWLAASAKFFAPFAALVAFGSRVGWRSAAVMAQPQLAAVVDSVSQPFDTFVGASVHARGDGSVVPAVMLAIWVAGSLFILLTWWTRWRRVAAMVRAASPIECGREHATLRRLEQAAQMTTPIALLSSDTSLEPGVFGTLKPALLWPGSIGERLDDRQVEAILAHEICHVRRRDNLAAAMHMVVEAVFWFHPLVWWLGARLVDERERACDEDVIRMGGDPQVYAESILKTCEFYVASPLPCVAGVTGSDLKKRIERIMENDVRATLSLWRKSLLMAAGVVAIAGPVAVGMLAATPVRAQSPASFAIGSAFAQASIKANTSDDRLFYPISVTDGRFKATNMRLRQLIVNVYMGLKLEGAPEWINDRFDIEARSDGNPSPQQMYAMARRLLQDRFKLVAHIETRQLPTYVLVLAKPDGTLGPQMRPSACTGKGPAPAGPMDPANPPPLPCGATQSRPGVLRARGTTMGEFVKGLTPMMGTTVQDRTGLSGLYDLEAQWQPAPGPPGPAALGVGSATFPAMEEQLGLKLASETGPVKFLVIEHMEKPSEN